MRRRIALQGTSCEMHRKCFIGFAKAVGVCTRRRFAFIVGIPLSYSIADGLALGFISYAIIKAFSGCGREISWLTYILAIMLVFYFLFVRSRMG